MSLNEEIYVLRLMVGNILVDAIENGDLFSKSGFISSYIDQIAKLQRQAKHHGEEIVVEVLGDPEPDSELKKHDLRDEKWREYHIPGRPEPYRIYDPVTLYTRPGGTTHRVVDECGFVHCIPFSVETALRCKPRNPDKPVAF